MSAQEKAKELMEIPKCSQHGEQMLKRERTTPEQDFCGTWYDCPRCGNSVLFHSPELREHLAQQSGQLELTPA